MKAQAKKKMEKMEEMDDEKESMEEEEEDKDMDKSELTENDLEKSLDKLAELAGETEVSRKDALLQKAQSGDLEDDEREELYGLLGGIEKSEEPDFADELTKSLDELAEDEEVQRVLDVSDYLSKSHSEIVNALSVVADRVENDSRASHEFNVVLAKSIHGLTRLVQDIESRLGDIESAPSRGPKSMGAPAALSKSFAGQVPGEDSLSKAEALDALGDMLEKAMERKDDQAANRYVVESAKIEQTGQLSAHVEEEIKQFRAAR